MAASRVILSVAQLALEIKQQHPQSASISDDELVASFLRENPAYIGNYQSGKLVSVSFASEAGGVAASSVMVLESGPADSPYLGATVVVKAESIPARLMVGKYEVIDELGRGGMGIVYKAFDPGIGRTVALKLMSEQLARDSEFRDRFLREARGAGILQHANIVTVHELGEWQGAPFIAMEFLQGRSLEYILKNEKTMSMDKRLDIVAQVCRGLDYAHARGIVHRDIKPANVMVTSEGVAKVVDFGIARLADQKLTSTGNVLGTVSYMSPEQLQGRTIDGRSDVFAVGVMLYEVLTSVLPFAAEDTGAAITNILYRQPTKLSSYLENYPTELDQIINKALAKDPAERFQTAGELADRIVQVQQELQRSQSAPTVIRTTPLPVNNLDSQLPLSARVTRDSKFSYVRRHHIVGLVAIVLLLLAAAVGWRILRLGSHPTANDLTELKKRAESGDAIAQYQLGRAFEKGRGVDRDDVEAVRWLQSSADQGNAHAQVDLGVAYCTGRGVTQNYSEGSNWFRKAAEQGDAVGEVNLGFQYEIGQGVTQNYAEAVRWYRKSAEQGNAHGQFNLGSMYLDGKGVSRDDSQGALWYLKASNQGDANAQNNLGSLYEVGRGVTKDLAAAASWYRKAADQGNSSAQNNLKRLDKSSGSHFGASQ
jgi:serine/threonine protein kinase